MPPTQRRRTTWPPCRPTARTGSSTTPPMKDSSQTKHTPPSPRKRCSTSSRRSAAPHRWTSDRERQPHEQLSLLTPGGDLLVGPHRGSRGRDGRRRPPFVDERSLTQLDRQMIG